MITYESPLSERIRTLLRLEDLFDKAGHFLRHEGAHEHHVVLVTLFEILDVAGRADLKVDLVQELERQRQVLLSFRNNPEISEDALAGALYEIEQASAALLAMAGKIGHYLRENEWLMSIKSRVGLPGGVCEFDVPSYHYWLNRDVVTRQKDLMNWISPMLPIRDGLTIVLRLLRASSRPERQVAVHGTFSQMMSGRAAQLVRLRLDPNEPFIPEISANKYALNIRFTSPDGDLRPRQSEADVPFDLAYCNL